MSENPFVGIWSVQTASKLSSLTEITIQQDSETQRFLITAGADLDLSHLVYDEQEDILIGSCAGTVGGITGLYDVAVVKFGSPPDVHCKGIIFSADGRH